MFSLFFICVALILMETDFSHCLLQEMLYGITLHNIVQTWEQAKIRCALQDSILASPIDGDIFMDMRLLLDIKNTTYYIGVKATQSPENFVSVEGVPIEKMTVAMMNMSPHLDPLDGECVAMNRHTMRVVPCWKRLPYMCLSRTRMQNPDAKYGYLNCNEDVAGYNLDMRTGKYYKLYNDPESWSEAQRICAADCGNLVVIENEIETDIVKYMYEGSYARLFVGLRLDHGTWRSVRGEPVSELYNTWSNGEVPNDAEFGCAAFYIEGKLDNVYCENELPFICERNNTAA